VYFLNQPRGGRGAIQGIPWVVALILVLMVFWTLVLSKSSFGRHLYAVGGNTEAARRAGIDVPRIKLAAFAIGSGMAALGGVALSSRLGSIPSTSVAATRSCTPWRRPSSAARRCSAARARCATPSSAAWSSR
jgi:D-xylose transport system permease protein